MDYKKIYDNLIISRSDQPVKKDGYYEEHHIIPKCLGGTNDKTNLILLTYREHFIAHLLLTKIYPENKGINYALLCMLRKHTHGRIITSKVYETIKKNYSKFKKLYCTIENPGKSENSRNAARKRMLERNPISIDPSKNRTAQKIKVHYMDGTIKEYSYAKLLTLIENIPYGTVKHMLKYNVGSEKWKIEKIERI